MKDTKGVRQVLEMVWGGAFDVSTSKDFRDAKGNLNEELYIKGREGIFDHATQQLQEIMLGMLPEKKTLAYRQGRSLPVLTGIEARDPDHVKAKKYINHGWNAALSEVEQNIRGGFKV